MQTAQKMFDRQVKYTIYCPLILMNIFDILILYLNVFI